MVLVIIDSLRKDHIGAYGNDDPDPQPRRPRQREPGLYPGLPRVHTHHLRQEGDTHGEADLALLQLEARQGRGRDPAGLGTDTPLSDHARRRCCRRPGTGPTSITDNMHQMKPSYDMHRGFDVFDFFRGQTTDNYKPFWTAPEDKVAQALVKGNIPCYDGPDAPVLRQRAG